MKLLSLETTPNPNSMKLNLEIQFPETKTYTQANKMDCPEFIETLLAIEGVISVFVCANFLTLNRDPRYDWQVILESATKLFTTEALFDDTPQKAATQEGRIQVHILMFKGIPMQVKAATPEAEKRTGLSQRFTEAVETIKAKVDADFIKERYWVDSGIRYGSLEEILLEVAEEIEGLYPSDKIARLIAEATGETPDTATTPPSNPQDLDSADWQERLRALQEMDATEESLAVFTHALADPKPQIRRWAAAKLGSIGSAKAVPFLVKALTDANIGVRRTVGDSLSDIGDASAQPAMCHALSDENKLVRWRAARYLSEVGTKEALLFLKNALDDPEYEVRLEAQSALQRIQEQRGAQGQSGPVWKQMAQE